MKTDKVMWWGYLHENGSVQVKRWFGDPKDFNEDCKDNPFVKMVVPPFAMAKEEVARRKVTEVISSSGRKYSYVAVHEHRHGVSSKSFTSIFNDITSMYSEEEIAEILDINYEPDMGEQLTVSLIGPDSADFDALLVEKYKRKDDAGN